ncbi:ABC-three component system middle component 1 [Enterococcus hirae]|uniref:ABC-three component system middle component 1 n=1 Tax=Enterococcus hirae TaxID=1354 RepID=UPI0015F25A55|nr:ABC-three component system middle component 1 [Enterococcus hirae]EMF0157468.1 hypothetical protein [Enterococcus hirae]MBA5258069.1 hypothetical protein [Enterococcus hirae]MCO5491867.1 hypothetical protein [Enterococcus hirae]
MVEILKEITTYEIIEKTTGLTCYTYQQANEKYRLHFFCYIFDNQDELLANYEEINDQIAYSFQSQLKRKIERWNIYFFLFVKAKVAKPIKASIEQDKYATRKVIVDNFRESGTNDAQKEAQKEAQKNKIQERLLLNLEQTKPLKKLAKNERQNDEKIIHLLAELKTMAKKEKKARIQEYIKHELSNLNVKEGTDET